MVVDPSSYDLVIHELEQGQDDLAFRADLARQAFAHTAAYDAAIAAWFQSMRPGAELQ